MFTGLVEETGIVKNISSFDGGINIDIEANLVFSDLKINDSVSINGACQTVIGIKNKTFSVQSIKETLDKTNFKELVIGSLVNLERSLLPNTRLGGHFVQGHVNGIATVSHISNRGENWYVGVDLSDDLSKYCIKEGSICLDGISLTIADIVNKTIFVSIIPHTWQLTAINKYSIGQTINIEVDMMAKYIYKYMEVFKKNS